MCINAWIFLIFISPLSLHTVSLGFPMSGDQPLGGLWSDWVSDRPHRLFHRHRGGGTGWV